jgi:hypothetical protein
MVGYLEARNFKTVLETYRAGHQTIKIVGNWRQEYRGVAYLAV